MFPLQDRLKRPYPAAWWSPVPEEGSSTRSGYTCEIVRSLRASSSWKAARRAAWST